MNMKYSYPTTTMNISIFAQMYLFLVEKYYLLFLPISFCMMGDPTSSVRRNCCMDSNIPFLHCSKSSVKGVKKVRSAVHYRISNHLKKK